MKVIFITREGYHLSGARVRCYNFARQLAEYGLETEVFSFVDNLGAKYGEEEFEMLFREKIKYNTQAFKKLIKKDKHSIFFMQRLNYHTLSPFLVSLLHRNKFIFDCDDWNIRENPVYYLGFYPSSKMEFLTRKLCAYADVCTMASKFLSDYFGRFGKKTHYMPTAVDTELFIDRGAATYGRITLCWMGTIYTKDMYDNVKFAIDIFKGLADRYDNIFLKIAAEGSYFDLLKQEMKEEKHREKIELHQWVDPDKMPEYLAGIDIGLLPLIQDSKFNQAKSPTKLFEYMAMSKPVVSSSIGEAVNIIDDANTGFLAAGKEEFTAKLESLVKDAGLRADLGSNARKYIEENCSLRVLGAKLHDIIRQLEKT